MQKRTELDRYIIHSAVNVQDKKQAPRPQKQTKQTKTPKSKQNQPDTKTKTNTAGGQLTHTQEL